MTDKGDRNYSRTENSLVGGFIRSRSDKHGISGPVSLEVPRADELTRDSLSPAERKALALSNDPDYRGKGQKRGRKLKLASTGIPQHLLDKADPAYKAALEGANKYRKYRSGELAVIHGYVSVGASSLLTSAAMALAASRYLYGKVCETGDLALLKTASQLADSARQNELAAYELSAREGTARRKATAADMGVPWLAAKDDPKDRGGRPRKASKAEDAGAPLPAIGGDLMSWVVTEGTPAEAARTLTPKGPVTITVPHQGDEKDGVEGDRD